MKVHFLLGAIFFMGCASNMDQFSNKVAIENANENQVVSTLAEEDIVVTSYEKGQKKADLETAACVPKKAGTSATVIIFSDDGFNTKGKLCDSWFMQIFLGGGFNVLAVNLPGQGGSTGESDFYGPRDLAAVTGVIDELSADRKWEITGVWGYSKSTIIASFYAKKRQDVKWLILGGGIYDLEKFHKNLTEGVIKDTLDKMHAALGDDFYEARSIAWDIEDLPKRIYLYHAIGDPLVHESMAVAFRDALAVKEYNVSFLGLQKDAHDLSPTEHRQVISKIMELLK